MDWEKKWDDIEEYLKFVMCLMLAFLLGSCIGLACKRLYEYVMGL